MNRLLVFICLLALGCPVQAQSPEQRIRALEGKLLAPCCYQEPVGRHQSEVALKMRIEIDRMVKEGKSDQEIIDGYVERYGPRVIADFAPTPPWAQVVPWVLLGLGTAGLAWWVRHAVRTHAAAHS
jgi:cytochrome c-type biogenesis protein CcmH